MAKWVDAGEQQTLEVLFRSTAVWATLYMGIYTDSSEPEEDAGLPTQSNPITELAVQYGYARISLTRGANWTRTGDYVTYAQQTFAASGGSWANCYGYFIATSSDNTGYLLCVEDFPSPPYNVPDGGSIKITPKITCA
jgi:hypothetical protein